MEILHKLTKPLLNPDEYPLTIDPCASFAAYISSVLYSEKLGLEYGDELLLSLFSLSCSICKDPDILSKDTLWEVTTAWQDILICVVPQTPKADLIVLTEKFAETLDRRLLSANAEQINVERIVNVVVSFTRCVLKTAPLLASEILLVLLNQELMDAYREKVNDLCVWSEYISGRLSSPYKRVAYPAPILETDIVKFFTMSHVKLKAIAEKLEEDEDEEEDGEAEAPSFIQIFENPARVLSDLLHTTCLALSYLDNYNVVSLCRERV